MTYQAVIFDLDGTLTDSAPGIIQSAQYALAQMNWPVPDAQDMRRYLGPPLMHSFTQFAGMTEAQAAQAQEIYRQYYIDGAALNNAVYPGIRQLLQALKKAGCSLGVATHKPLEPSLKILEAFDLLKYFDHVAGPLPGEDPSKAELIKRANPAGLPAIMVGDRATDVLGARQAGMEGIAALYGYGYRAEFEAIDTVHYAEDVQALYPLLGLEQPRPQGYFISFEGNDGAGKSTQAKLLAKKLEDEGYPVLLTREPGGTRVGEQIREILLNRENEEMDDLVEAMLYAAARAQHVRQVILPALKAGRLVISDRFVDSSIAYQGAGRGLGIKEVAAINAPAVAGCLPDTTVFLRLNPEEGIVRATRKGEADRLEAAGQDFHQKVAAAFDQLIADDERFVVISSTGSKQQTAQAVYQQVKTRLNQAGLA